MIDRNRYKFLLVQIIREINSDIELSVSLEKCIDRPGNLSDDSLLREMGELTYAEMKKFICTKLQTETMGLMELSRKFPIYS